jgi:hypothetical protein
VPGVAVKVTVDPPAKADEQVEPQFMPDGELVTLPVPVLVTVNVDENVAVTVLSEDMVTVHVLPLEEVQPVHVVVPPAAGTAVKVTVLCLA